MNPARALILAATAAPRLRFERAARRPREAQRRVWRQTWRLLSGSPFWSTRRHRGRLEDFPLTTYEDYREALERSFRSPSSELNGERIQFWSESAGSTGRRKVFPITETYRRQFQSINGPFMSGLAWRFPGLLSKPILYFAGTTPRERSPAGVEVGFISNFNYRRLPKLVRELYAFPPEVLRDADTFFEWGPLYALATDLSGIVGITPAILTRFFEGMWRARDRCLPLLRGQRRPPAPLPPLEIEPARLRHVERALAGELTLDRIWPSLSMIGCWKASTCGLQLPALEAMLDRTPIVDVAYSATEGWVNVPLRTDTIGGPIHAGAHVFEFLPEGEEADPRRLRKPWELEPGQRYELVLTTAMGLIRYRLFDIVEHTGRAYHGVPEIAFVTKANQQISLGPACVAEEELAAAAREAGVPAGGWVFAPAASGDHVELLVREDRPVEPAVAERIERSLRAVNRHYDSYVGQGSLRPLSIRPLPGTHPVFAALPHAQTKPRVLLHEPVHEAVHEPVAPEASRGAADEDAR